MAMTTRRQALVGSVLSVPVLASMQVDSLARNGGHAEARLADLERTHGGRLGVAVLNLSTGARAGHRADERFLLLSTFKSLLSACVLHRVDRGQERLDRRITFSKKDLVPWSPVTETRAGASGITVAELCEATVTLSDNTAGNLLLHSLGGPAELTAFLRGIGDEISRLDRFETALNEHDRPDDVRDTTTPTAVLETLRRLFFTDVLSPRARSQLAAWHIANKTGDKRLRAGMPAQWLVGDKTGRTAAAAPMTSESHGRSTAVR